MKLFAQIAMIVAFDVCQDAKRDGKLCPDSPVKDIALAHIVLAVEENVKDVLFLFPLGVVFRIDTLRPVEITIAQESNQLIVLPPTVIDVALAAALARNVVEAVRQDQRQEIPVRI